MRSRQGIDSTIRQYVKSLEQRLAAVTAERDKLKAEVVRLSGETGFCTECERQALEIEKLKAERKQSKPIGWRVPMPDGGGNEFNAGEPSAETVEYWCKNYGVELEYCYTHPPVPDGKVLVDKQLLTNLEFYVGNPSAWDSYSENVSEVIRAMLKSAQGDKK